jgi:hypothetical protein
MISSLKVVFFRSNYALTFRQFGDGFLARTRDTLKDKTAILAKAVTAM